MEARKTQSFFQENIIIAEKNQEFNFSAFLRKLDEMGYEKVYQISEIGEFAQRGGVIDVFPINTAYAVRFEFLGNKIESIIELPAKIEDEARSKRILKKKLKSQEIFSDLENLKIGDYLVHLDHGIGRFAGTVSHDFPSSEDVFPYEKKEQRYYLLEYAEGDRLYVPFGLERKLSRYISFIKPKVSRLGSPFWQKKKRKVKEDARRLAQELLKIYALRETEKKQPYLPDDEIDRELASSFPWQETPDQWQAIGEINRDLESERPMDRLLCADVGFGKTEVALRAMVKTVKSGWQAALLCPTTILANQHFNNFKKRLNALPVTVSLLSRLQSRGEQKEIIEKINSGEVDVIIGTHRLLSKDISFNKLGLLIIDDEHRFGVKQKERFKKLRASLNVLSLSATPIPRTLYLSLSSLRDISIIKTPPEGRLPVKTIIVPFSKRVIKKAIQEEMARRGQVYYLHNRIETIKAAQKFLKGLVPKARFDIAHGRLKEKEIVKVMNNLQQGKSDVLIATTIIENGLDFPNVNTLIVANASRLGLAEAHQLRGRVGRSRHQAFAYFLHSQRLKGRAHSRMKALKESQFLGSGYRIALRDMEIRGAGNILGKEQSGNINRVGLNLYCQMLAQEIEKIKRSPQEQASNKINHG